MCVCDCRTRTYSGSTGRDGISIDDCSQTSVALAQIGNPARQIDRCASGKIKHKSSKPAEAQPSARKGSLPQLQSGYFPEEGLLWESSPQGN